MKFEEKAKLAQILGEIKACQSSIKLNLELMEKSTNKISKMVYESKKEKQG